MTEFKLHCFPQSGNAYKVGLCLSLLNADWEPVAVDYFGGETRTKEWREAVNEMGEVPVLEHRGQKLAPLPRTLTRREARDLALDPV